MLKLAITLTQGRDPKMIIYSMDWLIVDEIDSNKYFQ